jgi:hypothetical protein
VSVPADKRKKHAVVRSHGRDRYPIYSEKTARSALRLIGHAKPPLTASEKAAVRRKAAKYGVHPAKK